MASVSVSDAAREGVIASHSMRYGRTGQQVAVC